MVGMIQSILFRDSGKDNMIIKRSDFEASLCKLVLTDASGNFIKEMIVNKVTNILW